MKIGIDIDGVIANMMPTLVRFHNDNYGTSLEIDNFKSHDLHETWGGTFEDAVSKVHKFYLSDYFNEIAPVEGSIEALSSLRMKNELFLITARPLSIEKNTRDWIDMHFGGMFSGMYMADALTLKSGSFKSQICNDLGIDVMIEDNIGNALECSKNVRHVFLFNTPWNQDVGLPENVTRIKSWNELIENLEKIK